MSVETSSAPRLEAERVGVVIVAHGKIGEAFLDAARQILGSAEDVATVCIRAPVGEERVLEEIERARKEVDRGRGVLILTDLFGGTPSNLSFTLLGDQQVEVLTGLNLGMLLKVLASRERVPLGELARMGKECGLENICLVRGVLEQGIPGPCEGRDASSGDAGRTK